MGKGMETISSYWSIQSLGVIYILYNNMNKTQIIYTTLFGVIVVLFSYILVMQPKVKAWNEILEIQQKLAELDNLEQQAKDNWHLAESNKAECIESWNEQQRKESELAESYRTQKADLEERLGLIMQR